MNGTLSATFRGQLAPIRERKKFILCVREFECCVVHQIRTPIVTIGRKLIWAKTRKLYSPRDMMSFGKKYLIGLIKFY